ncbi:MAG: amidohydrolase family protein, partial [Planctomycetota bacterium]
TIIGGYGAILKPTVNTLESMLRKEPGMIRISLGADSRHSRIRKMATLRQTFQETLIYRETLQSKENLEISTVLSPHLYLESADPVKQPLIDLIEGRLIALIHCPEPGDCFRALELAKTFQFKPILQLGPRAFLAADLLKQAGVSILLDSEISLQEDFKGQGDLETVILPLIYHQKGIPFCLSSRGRRFLWYQAGLALQGGLPREEALKSITLYPAQILGLEKEIGSLIEGKSADFVILSGDPLDIRTWVEEVWIEGKKVYSRKEDIRLKHFSGEPSQNTVSTETPKKTEK